MNILNFIKQLFKKKYKHQGMNKQFKQFEQFQKTDKGLRYLTSDGDFIYFKIKK